LLEKTGSNIKLFSADTVSIRHEGGTVFVNAICVELKRLEKKISLLEYLIRVQKAICEKSLGISNDAQTPQLQYFSNKKIVIQPRMFPSQSEQTFG